MTAPDVRREAFYLETPGGRRFCIAVHPVGPPRGGLLFVPPFAEELNRSRRMAALASRTFARQGWLVLSLDLGGTGDSEGDFGEASWDGWIADVSAGVEWLQASGIERPALWTLRMGSLLAGAWMERGNRRLPLLLWQPVFKGAQSLTQFLRLAAAHEQLEDGATPDAGAALASVRSALASGRAVEVAGYRLSAALARGIEAAALDLPAGYPSPVAAVEVVGVGRKEPSPAVATQIARWQAAGVPVRLTTVEGLAFWTTQEIEETPGLTEASLEALEGLGA